MLSVRKPIKTASASLTVALAGNPNSGKTTLFNALTGLRQKVANYPGVTVEKKTGKCSLPNGQTVEVVDLPGTYSLISRSPDEIVAMEVLRGLLEGAALPDVVIVVVDASNLQRNLYLVSQLVELGRPMVMALNMVDVAERRGIHIDSAELSRLIGIPVVPVIGCKGEGVDKLKAEILNAKIAQMPRWSLPAEMIEELKILSKDLSGVSPELNSAQCDGIAERLLVGDDAADVRRHKDDPQVQKWVQDARARLMDRGIDPMQADIEAHYRWIEQLSDRSIGDIEELAAMGLEPEPPTLKKGTFTERIDRIFIHKIWGFVVFTAIMATLFVSLFWLAGPMMDFIGGAIDSLGSWATSGLNEGPIKSLIYGGVFQGVGAVVIFLPQIALLFLFLAILEDSGYLARAAFLMDRVLSKVGLHGKSFIPLLSSFACAIPGVLATRTIENRRDRLATILVLPFMSCSARLPVYTLLIGTMFAARGAAFKAGLMLCLYVLGIIAAVLTSLLFRKTVLKGAPSAFILELPSYKFPQASSVLRQVAVNSWEFLSKAGTTIFCLCILLWGLTYYGASSSEMDKLTLAGEQQQVVDAYRLNNSFAGQFGKALEPVIRPLGYDWKMGIGLVGAFAAREVFVSTLAITYAQEEGELSQAMLNDLRPDGSPVWTLPTAISLLVWFVLAMQCASTLAIVKRETGGWRWPLFMLVYMNGLAYAISFGVYQGCKAMGL